MPWVKLVREENRFVYGSRSSDEPFPTGVSVKNESTNDYQVSLSSIAVDGEIVVNQRRCHHGQDRNQIFQEACRLAEENRLKHRKKS